MFADTSRYFGLETARHTAPDGREVVYARRRFIPAPSPVALAEHVVTQGERLDNITARYLGDPELFWALCDDNNAMRPAELTEEVGRRLRVAMPRAEGEA